MQKPHYHFPSTAPDSLSYSATTKIIYSLSDNANQPRMGLLHLPTYSLRYMDLR
jgi:hypothetical protein